MAAALCPSITRTRLAVHEEVFDAGHPPRDDGYAQGHGFEHGQPLAFVRRQRRKQRPAAHEAGDVPDLADDAHDAAQTQTGYGRSHAAAVGLVGHRADQFQPRAGQAASEHREGFDQRHLVLARLDAADTPDYRRGGRRADTRLVGKRRQIEAPGQVRHLRPRYAVPDEQIPIGVRRADDAVGLAERPHVLRVHPRRAVRAPAIHLGNETGAGAAHLTRHRGAGRRHAGMRMNDPGRHVSHDRGETRGASPETLGVPMKDVDPVVGDAGPAQRAAIRRPVGQPVAGAGRHDRHGAVRGLIDAQPGDDPAGATPQKWGHVQDGCGHGQRAPDYRPRNFGPGVKDRRVAPIAHAHPMIRTYFGIPSCS